MSRRFVWMVSVSLAVAIAVFLVVQDRITASGASEYVMRQRAAQVGGMPAVTIDQVMGPAVRRSVRVGLLWGSLVFTAGLGAAICVERLRGARGKDRAQSRR